MPNPTLTRAAAFELLVSEPTYVQVQFQLPRCTIEIFPTDIDACDACRTRTGQRWAFGPEVAVYCTSCAAYQLAAEPATVLHTEKD